MANAVAETKQLLTHTRMACYKTCARRHYLEFELGIRPDRESTPLRFGSAYHLGQEVLGKTGSLGLACDAIRENYDNVPDWVEDINAWQCECETVIQLLCGWQWYWESEPLKILATEQEFQLKIRNPETGASTISFDLAGKIDKIVRLQDFRAAILEHKTTGDSIDSGSDYWTVLQRAHQPSEYMIAARELGHNVDCVLYDIVHKPGMKPYKATPPEKRKYKKDGTPYASTRERDETAEEWGLRLAQDIASRPEFYFARKEIARTDDELDLFCYELWQQQQQIRESQRSNRWPRNTNSCLHPYKCPYHDSICDMKNIENETLPEGWQYVENIHPELKERTDGIRTGTTEERDTEIISAAETASASATIQE